MVVAPCLQLRGFRTLGTLRDNRLEEKVIGALGEPSWVCYCCVSQLGEFEPLSPSLMSHLSRR